ncbi:MAG: alanine/glycine:cation symporter family protein [Bacteroidales bacterium]
MWILTTLNDLIWNYIVVWLMVICALWFTIKTRFVQFSMFPEMLRIISKSTSVIGERRRNISSFEAFTISLASRVGVGNLAGVALAITIGGAGAIFWMWIMAIINAATAFIEATLAQLYKSRSKDAFIGGPAYYINKGLKNRTLAIIVVILTIITFSFTICSVQSNTIAISAYEAFGMSRYISALIIGALMFVVIFGGVQRVAKVSGMIVPVMAFAYIVIVLFVIVTNISRVPDIITTIVENAFGINQVIGGSVGMAFMLGSKRGLFSNEAGMGSAPNAAATADVSHPVNQGLIQSLGVFVDTLVICSCTAFIIFLSPESAPSGMTGITLTQFALSNEVGFWAYSFIAVIIFFFGFSTCISNAYYGESNIRFITENKLLVNIFRVAMVIFVMIGSIVPLEFIWALADFLMIFIVFINLVSITKLGKYVYLLLDNYRKQKKAGIGIPVFTKKQIPELDVPEVECW